MATPRMPTPPPPSGPAWSAAYDAAGEDDLPCGDQRHHLRWRHADRRDAELRQRGATRGVAEHAEQPDQHRELPLRWRGQSCPADATTSGTASTTSYIGSLEEVTTSGATTTTTAYYGGVALSVNGALSYTLSDGLGSVSESVNTSGAVTATQLYGPYGAVRYQSGTLPTDQGFTGQRADAVSGLDYYGARYYDPVAGQFTSADTTLAGG